MPEPTNLVADTICRTVELGLTITGAAISERFTHIDCRPVEPNPTCPSCGAPGQLRDHVDRVLTDLPVVGHPTRLRILIPRFNCGNPSCQMTIFRQNLDGVAAPKAAATRRCARWILQRLAIDKMSVSAVAKALGLGWATVNALALSLTRDLVYNQTGHLDRVRVLGVDEHKWKHVRGQGDPSFVTVIVDLTPVFDAAGPARLLAMVPGRSTAALKDWLEERDQSFRDRVKVIGMVPRTREVPPGFAGCHRAAKEALPQARTVMDPFHVVHLVAEKLTIARQRILQQIHGHRGRSGDPLYRIRRVLLTREELRTDRQKARLAAVFADEAHIGVEVTHGAYQDLVAAYGNPDRRAGKIAMFKVLKRIKSGVPKALPELAQLGRGLWRRRKEILAYFDTGALNGPVEAIVAPRGRGRHILQEVRPTGPHLNSEQPDCPRPHSADTLRETALFKYFFSGTAQTVRSRRLLAHCGFDRDGNRDDAAGAISPVRRRR